MFEELAQRDPAAAAERAGQLADSKIQTMALKGALEVWAKQDAQGAIAFVDTLEGFEAKAIKRALIARLNRIRPSSGLTLVN